MVLKYLTAAAFVLAPMPIAAQGASCDQIWTAYQSFGSPEAPERNDTMTEEVYRYRAGSAVFATTYTAVQDQTVEQVQADGGNGKLMEISLRLSVGDKLLTCYADPAAATDEASAAFVKAVEAELTPEDRAAIVARFKPAG